MWGDCNTMGFSLVTLTYVSVGLLTGGERPFQGGGRPNFCAAERAMNDVQLSAHYVAYNLHYLSYLTGGAKVAVLGHSQGNLNILWALRFWPSVRNVTSMYIGLSPNFVGSGGITGGTFFCSPAETGLRSCQDSFWQQNQGSKFYAALNYKGHLAFVPSTTIWTEASIWNASGRQVLEADIECRLMSS